MIIKNTDSNNVHHDHTPYRSYGRCTNRYAQCYDENQDRNCKVTGGLSFGTFSKSIRFDKLLATKKHIAWDSPALTFKKTTN